MSKLLEWIEKNAAEGADLEAAKKLYKEENPLAEVKSADEALQVLKQHDVLKSALDKETTQRVEKAQERWESEKLPMKEKEIRDKVQKELNPEETPEQKELRELKEWKQQQEQREQRRQTEEQLAAKAKELGFDPEKARKFAVFGENAEKELETFAEDWKKSVENTYQQKIKEMYGNKPPEAPPQKSENAISRSEFDQLDSAAQRQHVKDGGEIYDD